MIQDPAPELIAAIVYELRRPIANAALAADDEDPAKASCLWEWWPCQGGIELRGCRH